VWLIEVAGSLAEERASSVMIDDDPLWYDREEPEEPLGWFEIVLLGCFAVGECIYRGAANASRILRMAIIFAFRDVRT